MRSASAAGSADLARSLGLRAAHRLTLEGIIGAVVEIAKVWIERDFREPVDEVVEVALPFARLR